VVHDLGQGGVQIDGKVQFLVVGNLIEVARYVILHVVEIDLTDVEGDGAGFDLREIENVVDQTSSSVPAV